jgi:poly [ADP-ribose] polymerase
MPRKATVKRTVKKTTTKSKATKKTKSKAAAKKVTVKTKNTSKKAVDPQKGDDTSKKISTSNQSLTTKAINALKASGVTGSKTPKKGRTIKHGKGGAKKTTKPKAAAKKADTNIITQKFRGAPVDPEFKRSGYHVYCNAGTIYAKTLNLSNIGGNNNKFYILQVLENDAKNRYITFFRWGRVGTPGAQSTTSCSNVTKAINLFNKKLSAKKCKYTEIDIVHEDELTPEEQAQKMADALKDSKLAPEVNQLVNLLFDTKLINNSLVEIGYDAKKMPLGKLSSKSIDQAFGILNSLMKELNKKTTKSSYNLQFYSSQFYTLIPHNFGFQKMSNFTINTKKKVQEKLDFLNTLKNMKITKSITDDVGNDAANVLEANFEKLKCDVTPVAKGTDTWGVVDKYLQSSNPPNHRCYKIKLENLYELDREGELDRFNTYNKDIGNRRLLWHGSRLTNFVGIISQGLRIAPPEAPCSGYLFGKGVYFADMIAKSANYCRAGTSNMTAMILLCEVACGNPNKKQYFDSGSANLPKGKHCTKGMGRNHPDPKNEVTHDDVIFPMGPPMKGDDGEKRGISYNEWIVYNTSQIKMKYLLKCKFS